jgi:hypothetical protein
MDNLIHKKLGIALISGCLMMWVGIAQAAPLVVFSNGGVADADDVNANFNELGVRIETISLTPGPAGATGVAGADGDAGTPGEPGLGAVVFSSAPTVNDDMDNDYSVGTVWVDTSTNTLYILEDNTANAAVWIIAAAPAVTYALGDTGPAGGFVFYVTAGGLRGLEAAPSDQDDGTGIRWDSPFNSFTDTGATADGIGAGDMNTILIISKTAGTEANYAASIAANLVISYLGVDYSDWYLPSKFELNLIWLNLADPIGDGRDGEFDDDSLGGFSSNVYWSSSQNGTGNASGQSFGLGGQFDGYGKATSQRVRAVRAF